MEESIEARVFIPGVAEGNLIGSNVALSFWGGVDPQTGTVIDTHHPLVGKSVAGKVLAIPSGRGSCTGSGVILELLLNGSQPSALIFAREEMILTIGVLIAEEMFQRCIPVLQVSSSSFQKLLQLKYVRISGTQISGGKKLSDSMSSSSLFGSTLYQPDFSAIQLSPLDRELLDGSYGKAAQVAMRVILRTANIQGVTELIDVKQAHIDCCIYTGPATLEFAQTLCRWGAKVRIPTSLNSISIDRRLWRSQGVDPSLGEPSEKLAQAYLEMGARPTFTCAPYLLDTAPKPGDNIMWAESNAVVFANSVLGARTIKCPDYLDVCVALTGRSLNTGCHLTENRKARLEIHLDLAVDAEDSLFALLGYLAGDIAADSVPIITGLEKKLVSTEDLKAFGAAFATTSSAPMFHIAGVTIEARSTEDIEAHLKVTTKVTLSRSDLAKQWERFNVYAEGEQCTQIDLVSLGNPHFSYEELVTLAHLCSQREKSEHTVLVVTCNRDTYSRAAKDGLITTLEAFGAQIVTDTCWCMMQEPIIPLDSKTIMTNSAKYAHYGKGLTGRQIRFGGWHSAWRLLARDG
ncbi:Aconitase/3-isopropylmalate dehydratase large subunit alpha/beta/alpha subdomain 1/3 [Penicillium cataractarum]|uniref:Aconitase/3-isopropylmalate dehydratase large subunit alpha/beta/alpha subdomain 1/3 n=1 Tax=Penicillium cataractarum TaxID=2100454 RepID=A0A9W9SJN0_9EURO|nr:Aconitase/3-isopropylmalate dehydratase large subunit alpha/beta/alpha subdomain 1/3 [Penicillium cataractarum]KAJ5379758.1 Aconitase/3-isopropylmalate dehydratase large subunit alpha/beta/alpha subdomain 1/3 [Penicillium cataractarum]